MALKNLNEIRNLQDPLRQFQAEFIISGMPGMMLAAAQQKILGVFSGNSSTATTEELRLRCTSFSYPSPKLKQSTVIIGGFRRRIGTIQDKSGIWKCRVTEDQKGSVLNIIQGWCDLIHNNISGTRLPSIAYVGTAQVILGGDILDEKRTVWLQGFYPIEYKVNDIDPSSSEAISVDISFNYNYYSENSFSIASLF